MRVLLLLFVAMATACNTFGTFPDEAFDDSGGDAGMSGDSETGDVPVEPDLSECADPGPGCGECGAWEQCLCGRCDSGVWSWARLGSDGGEWSSSGGTFTVQDGEIEASGGAFPAGLSLQGLGDGVHDVGQDWRARPAADGDLIVFFDSTGVDQIWAVRDGISGIQDPGTVGRFDMFGVRIETDGSTNATAFEDRPLSERTADDRVAVEDLDGLRAIGSIREDREVGVFELRRGEESAGIAIAVQPAEQGFPGGTYAFTWLRDDVQSTSMAGTMEWSSDTLTPEVGFAEPAGVEVEMGIVQAEGRQWQFTVDSDAVSLDATYSESADHAVGVETGVTGLLFLFRPFEPSEP